MDVTLTGSLRYPELEERQLREVFLRELGKRVPAECIPAPDQVFFLNAYATFAEETDFSIPARATAAAPEWYRSMTERGERRIFGHVNSLAGAQSYQLSVSLEVDFADVRLVGAVMDFLGLRFDGPVQATLQIGENARVRVLGAGESVGLPIGSGQGLAMLRGGSDRGYYQSRFQEASHDPEAEKIQAAFESARGCVSDSDGFCRIEAGL
jgi:hypothetical protein